jgi:hypothetical protein
MPFPIHPHMLRHACGFKLANRPRHAGFAALPRAQEHSAHGQVHRNGTRPLQGLLEGLTRIALSIAPACDDPRGGKVSGLGPAKGVCARAWAMAQPEASARWEPGARQAPPLPQSPPGAGNATGSAFPSISCPASSAFSRWSSISLIAAIAVSICSSVRLASP